MRFYPDAPAVAFGDLFADRQAEPGAGTSPLIVRALEYADAVVAHREMLFVFLLLGQSVNARWWRKPAGGISNDEVLRYLQRGVVGASFFAGFRYNTAHGCS